MSVKITVTELHAAGRKYTIETPLSSIAATDSQTPYVETQRMIADHAALTLEALTASGELALPLHPDSRVHVEIRNRRLLDSCYVRPAYGRELLLEDELVVVVCGPGGEVLRFVVREFTPLRRVLNAFAGVVRRDVRGLELRWRGRRVGLGERMTARKLGITHEAELEVVAIPRRKRRRRWSKIGGGSSVEIKSEPSSPAT